MISLFICPTFVHKSDQYNMEKQQVQGFRGWREAGSGIKITWKDAYELNNNLPMLKRQCSGLVFTVLKNERMVTIKGLSPTQVFFIKEWAVSHDATARELK